MKFFRASLIIVLSVLVSGAVNSTPVFAAGAATVSLSGSNSSVVGENFEVNIAINPNNEALDTVRINLSFPADLVQVDHFTLGDLFPRSSPGNKIDNTTGEISEGGFNLSGPVTSSGTFGTVVFKSIKAGNANIKVLNTSRLIANGEEKISVAELGERKIIISEAAIPETEAIKITVNSLSHPNQNQWYSTNDVTFSWASDSGVTNYGMIFDQNLTNEQVSKIDSTSVTIKDTEDGIWYLHLQGQSADGRTNTVNYKVMIDTAAPNKFEPVLDKEQLSEGENITLTFGTTDELSGIAKYEVAVNGGDFEEKTSPVLMEKLAAGNYFIEVRALDLAGNKIYSRAVARVYPAGVELPPVITAKPATNEVVQGNLAIEYLKNKALVVGVVIGGVILVGFLILLKRRKNKFKKL
ncbi:MAG: cohesin domain-containing protein [Candidatus Uhrbacteria bacterium]